MGQLAITNSLHWRGVDAAHWPGRRQTAVITGLDLLDHATGLAGGVAVEVLSVNSQPPTSPPRQPTVSALAGPSFPPTPDGNCKGGGDWSLAGYFSTSEIGNRLSLVSSTCNELLGVNPAGAGSISGGEGPPTVSPLLSRAVSNTSRQTSATSAHGLKPSRRGCPEKIAGGKSCPPARDSPGLGDGQPGWRAVALTRWTGRRRRPPAAPSLFTKPNPFEPVCRTLSSPACLYTFVNLVNFREYVARKAGLGLCHSGPLLVEGDAAQRAFIDSQNSSFKHFLQQLLSKTNHRLSAGAGGRGVDCG